MRKFKTLTVKGLPLFEDQSFDLSQTGVSVILGLNLNSARQATSGPVKGRRKGSPAAPSDLGLSEYSNTNAVGKSLFFSQLFELFFKEGVTGNAKDKVTTGSVTLEIDVGKHAYVITKSLKGKTDKLSITKDGVDITPANSLKNARDLVLRILGRTHESFSVVDYIDNTKPHILRTGTTEQRKAFFTQFFDLESADFLRKIINQEKAALRKQAAVLAALQEQLNVSASAKQDLTAAKAELTELESKLATTTKQLEALREAKEYEEYVAENSKLKGSLLKLGYQLEDTSFQDVLTEAAQVIDAGADAVRSKRAYDKAVLAAQEANAARIAYLEEHSLTSYDPEEGERRLESVTAHHDKLFATWKEETRLVEDAQRTLKDLEKQQAVNKANRIKLKQAKTCPACGQDVTNEHLKEEQAALREAYALLTTSVETEAASLATLQGHASHCEESVSKWKAKADKQRAKHNLYLRAPKARTSLPDKPDLSAWKRLRASNAISANVTSKDPEILSVLQRESANCRRLIEDMDVAQRHTENWRRLFSGESVSVDDAKLSKLTDRALALTEQLGAVRSRVSMLRERLEERRDLRNKIKALQDELAELDALDVLDKAFSSSAGVKQMVINTICRSLEAQVNKYAKFLFSEDYMFEFDLSTQFNITCTRTLEDVQLVSDVRKLSGAEAGLFNLLLALSLLTFLPPSQRSNILILDELNANFGAEVNSAFIRFLPILNKVVPHIIVITPRSQDDYGTGARYFTVVKQGKVSKMIQGKRSSI